MTQLKHGSTETANLRSNCNVSTTPKFVLDLS